MFSQQLLGEDDWSVYMGAFGYPSVWIHFFFQAREVSVNIVPLSTPADSDQSPAQQDPSLSL